jgi:hypothetical protein
LPWVSDSEVPNKGKGTYKGKLGADDIGTMELEGEYQLPPTK